MLLTSLMNTTSLGYLHCRLRLRIEKVCVVCQLHIQLKKNLANHCYFSVTGAVYIDDILLTETVLAKNKRKFKQLEQILISDLTRHSGGRSNGGFKWLYLGLCGVALLLVMW